MSENVYERDLMGRGIIYFTGEVTQKSMCNLSEKIMLLNEDLNFNKPIQLYINSPGGDLAAAFGAIEILRRTRLKIVTIAVGEICSCGLLLFLAGDYRVITKNTAILSHQYFWGMKGKHAELTAARKEQDLTYKRLVNYYKARTGMAEGLIKEKLLPATDVWLTPKEAIRYKIASKIT